MNHEQTHKDTLTRLLDDIKNQNCVIYCGGILSGKSLANKLVKELSESDQPTKHIIPSVECTIKIK